MLKQLGLILYAMLADDEIIDRTIFLVIRFYLNIIYLFIYSTIFCIIRFRTPFPGFIYTFLNWKGITIKWWPVTSWCKRMSARLSNLNSFSLDFTITVCWTQFTCVFFVVFPRYCIFPTRFAMGAKVISSAKDFYNILRWVYLWILNVNLTLFFLAFWLTSLDW